MMSTVAYIDIETDSRYGKILDIGGIRSDGLSFHGCSMPDFSKFLNDVDYICGHNIINHDLKYLEKTIPSLKRFYDRTIDTLYWSPLLFPRKPYHALLKDEKLQTDELNNPLNDSIKAKDLFNDEISAFLRLDEDIKEIYYRLLSDISEFKAFFKYIGYSGKRERSDRGLISRFFQTTPSEKDLSRMISFRFRNMMCAHAGLEKIILTDPVSLAYSLALIDVMEKYHQDRSLTPGWVLRNFPKVEQIMFKLRSSPCIEGCPYCNKAFDARAGLKQWFGFDSFRSYNGDPLQEKAVNAAVRNESLLAVFPTGGGKSLTFQLPALMAGDNATALTVVISPLQSLMKDQVDNLEHKGITEAVTINGMLDPVDRAKSFERVENGMASILYISPESLRSVSIERMILKRKIARFVIDEAHCFSSWGQDFRVDYLYIADFIKAVQEKKNLQESIPVSCFTATAKPQVIEDIRNYFKSRLSVNLQLFTTTVSRPNLHYLVLPEENDEEKYKALRRLLEENDSPAIVYVVRTKKAEDIANRLNHDGFVARPYHGNMKSDQKIENQNAFMSGAVRIIVATSAFGMGVDKSDVGLVVHFEISDSLENYVQEAGRAGRDENIEANCYVLFNDEDLSKHFLLLNQTKITIKEIRQVWKAIKDLTRFRSKISNSALEIARKAGWDDSVADIEMRVKTAITSLEQSGYLKRGQNMPRVYATGILAKNAQEVIDKINASPRFDENTKVSAIRIIRSLISSRSCQGTVSEEAESRIDYLSDRLGIRKKDVIHIINIFREERILADSKDVTVYFGSEWNRKKPIGTVLSFSAVENFLIDKLEADSVCYLDYKKLNDVAEADGIKGVEAKNIKIILNIWAINGWIKKYNFSDSRNVVKVQCLKAHDNIRADIASRQKLALFIIEYLYSRMVEPDADKNGYLEISILELKDAYTKSLLDSDEDKISLDDVEDALFYLSRIEAIRIEGGFLVIYNTMTIERLELDNKRQYKVEDYQRLGRFYENKIQQIHIVGEYARKMIGNYKDALQFVEDYFQMGYPFFLRKYFNGRESEIVTNITPRKFNNIFGTLSPAQLKIINDKNAKYIVVAAGPGSGKTRILVHKLASLMMMEDVKHEQLLMLTFSRAAATEFKARLFDLIGNAALFVEIKTFHSYCFDLLGQIGNAEKSDAVVSLAVSKIHAGDVDVSRITKTVLVIDEAQDMDADEFKLVEALMAYNEDMRVIAVGDDDQNIYEFRGSSPEFMERILSMPGAVKYELLTNYRSNANLVEFAGKFVSTISRRMKEHPVLPYRIKNGRLVIVKYSSGNLVTPLADSIVSTRLIGTVAVLTRSNDEALTLAGLLQEKGLPARLIQTNSDFDLTKLVETRFFMQAAGFYEEGAVFDDDRWCRAKSELYDRFARSDKLYILHNLLNAFESVHRKVKYKSDFKIFVDESGLEDFSSAESSMVIVSTIHKVKGREFDNVFLLIDNIYPKTDEDRRQLYVAMTRAKENLFIHINTSFLDEYDVEGIERINDGRQYGMPEKVVLATTMKDVWLNDFIYRQTALSNLASGDKLVVNAGKLCDLNGKEIVKFSNAMRERMNSLQGKGYRLYEADVNFIVWWKCNDVNMEIKVLLPKLYFKLH